MKVRLNRITIGWLSAAIILIFAIAGDAQTTEFTYQGKLTDSAGAAAAYDFEFRLCSSESGSCSAPFATFSQAGVVTANGTFSVKVDFGQSVFDGTDRYIEVAIKRVGETTYTSLAPRQKITSSPHAIQSLKATNALQLGGTPANQYVLTTDPRLSPINYVVNGTTAQTGVNFNVGGTGTANVLNAATQYNILGNRVLSSVGSGNLFAGFGAGQSNAATGTGNSFFGTNAGGSNTTGDVNTFVGSNAGILSTASANTFVGGDAGRANTTGADNTFVGAYAGLSNSTGPSNSFFGSLAGGSNSIGPNNSFFGAMAGANNFSGGNSSFFGAGAGKQASSYNNSFFGSAAGEVTTTGSNNSFFGTYAGRGTTTGSENTFIGDRAGYNNTTGSRNVFIGSGASNTSISTQINDSVVIGRNAVVSGSNQIVLGTSAHTTMVSGTLKALAGGESGLSTVRLPLQTVVSANSTWGQGVAVNSLHLGVAPQVFLNTPLCFQAGIGVANHVTVGLCPSSFAPGSLKTNMKPFTEGIEIVKRLRPVSFRWKEHDSTGVGLNAEEVALIDPQLVARDEKGEILKVNENSVNAVLINAVKEQQKQLEAQQKEIDALKKLLCRTNSAAEVCKEENED